MPEYMEHRCCMCPNPDDLKQTECPPGPMKDKVTPCRFIKAYIDKRGWKYKVLPGLGENNYKARYQKPDKSGMVGWKCVRNLPWRNSFFQAQSDLNMLAKEKCWQEWE